MQWTRGPIIGRGSTATVSLATSTSSGELLALKSAELSKSMLLQKEQYVLSRLSSPYVVRYLGYEITNENSNLLYNICMEYAPGGTLHDAIRRHGGQLDETLIRSYTRDIIKGLDYLHTNGLVHCDIKTQNVLISKGAKVADFGCARYVEETTVFSGTPAFMSPEVSRGEEQGFPADMWAVGCTVIEMATGKIPWAEHNDDPVSALFKIGFSDEVPKFPLWLSDNGKDFLSKCLKREPRERWTAKQLLDHPFLDDQDLTMASPSCVLDQDLWDSMEGFETPHDFSNYNYLNLNSAAERIKSLIGSAFSLNWSWDKDWITVRSSDSGEKDVMSADSSSVPSAILASDSIVYEQELESSSLDQDLLLDMEFFLENHNRISDSISNFSTNEYYDFVFENLNFETDNDKLYLVFFNLICLFFSLFLRLNRLTTCFLYFPLSGNDRQKPIPLFFSISSKMALIEFQSLNRTIFIKTDILLYYVIYNNHYFV